MSILFIEYPKCSTCVKAKKFLKEAEVEFEDRNIVENNPTADELLRWFDESGMEFKKFFNTSGMLYKELKLKDKVKNMTREEAAELLATNGMLVKRPVLVTDKGILTGFKEEQYKQLLGL